MYNGYGQMDFGWAKPFVFCVAAATAVASVVCLIMGLWLEEPSWVGAGLLVGAVASLVTWRTLRTSKDTERGGFRNEF